MEIFFHLCPSLSPEQRSRELRKFSRVCSLIPLGCSLGIEELIQVSGQMLDWINYEPVSWDQCSKAYFKVYVLTGSDSTGTETAQMFSFMVSANPWSCWLSLRQNTPNPCFYLEYRNVLLRLESLGFYLSNLWNLSDWPLLLEFRGKDGSCKRSLVLK